MPELACPACGTGGGADERFCPRCGMPLVHADVEAVALTDRQQRARKISPQYGEGRLVKVGWARNQAEAELMCGLLLEEGIPSMNRRAGGFDVPDFLAAGPRDILVAASGVDLARDLLGTVPDHQPVEREPTAMWVRMLAMFLVAVTVAIVAAGVVSALLAD